MNLTRSVTVTAGGVKGLPNEVRWLSDEPDPRDLMRPFPSEPMRMWPISTRVNKPPSFVLFLPKYITSSS
jgi:hypothetical protein